MLNYLVEEVLKFKNSLPTTTGISDTISPSTLVLGKPTLDYNEMRIEFGSYAQVFEERRVTNTTATRSIGAIALASYPDSIGQYPFMNINTGRLLYRRKFTVLPVTDYVVQRVNELGKRDKQAPIDGGCPLVEWRPGRAVSDETTNQEINTKQNGDDESKNSSEETSHTEEDTVNSDANSVTSHSDTSETNENATDERSDNFDPPPIDEDQRSAMTDRPFENLFYSTNEENYESDHEDETQPKREIEHTETTVNFNNQCGTTTADNNGAENLEDGDDENTEDVDNDNTEYADTEDNKTHKYNTRGNRRNYAYRFSNWVDDSDGKTSYRPNDGRNAEREQHVSMLQTEFKQHLNNEKKGWILPGNTPRTK